MGPIPSWNLLLLLMDVGEQKTTQTSLNVSSRQDFVLLPCCPYVPGLRPSSIGAPVHKAYKDDEGWIPSRRRRHPPGSQSSFRFVRPSVWCVQARRRGERWRRRILLRHLALLLLCCCAHRVITLSAAIFCIAQCYNLISCISLRSRSRRLASASRHYDPVILAINFEGFQSSQWWRGDLISLSFFLCPGSL